MGSGAHRVAAVLLALFTMAGLGAGGAAADPRPVPDGETRDSVSKHRAAARAVEQRRDEPRPRCHRREKNCGFGLPSREQDELQSPGGDGGWGSVQAPEWNFRSPLAPPRVPPPVVEPPAPDVVDTVPGVGLPATSPAGAPISVPVLPMVPVAVAPRPAGPGGPAAAAPRPQAPPEPPARSPGPRAAESTAPLGNSGVASSAPRVGYADYLRGAGLAQIAAVALPGLAGILVLTGAGGLLGYRQAKAGRAVAVRPVARFIN
ncbi:hypothetical protein ACAG25_05750 [Mycobacterium sp. pV006]|uniref:hypothetical protein n=1 Tax=Mycobacterium sp. pV006 TaxID=3238983 RepID=UPI00351B6484